MVLTVKKGRLKTAIKFLLVIFLFIFLLLLLFANRFVEPMLRQRLHGLIIVGSDSLYKYKLGDLNANFFGGNVEVENLQIEVDSNHYHRLSQQNALPSLTMQLNLQQGLIRGLSVFTLLFGKKINIREILSKEADLILTRHIRQKEIPKKTTPLWKAIQPIVKSIHIGQISLAGVKLLYKNADTSESVKLQFDRCLAVLKNVQVDSASAADTMRIAFAKQISMQFYDLKFRTPDSSYKLKAEVVQYSSDKKLLQIKDFKIQPTLEKNDFFKSTAMQKSRYVMEFEEAQFTNIRIDRFIHSNIIAADSVFITQPELSIDTDKTLPPTLESKFGRYPHQSLLKANPLVMIKGMRIRNAVVTYTEKSKKTGKEGKLVFSKMNISISNVTNNANLIKQNAQCVALVQAQVFDSSPLQTKFTFYLDSTEGQYTAQGEVRNLKAEQLNRIAVPLNNTEIRSLHINYLRFAVSGDDYGARGRVQMSYNNLAIALRKKDEETGAVTTKKFLTKLINKYTLYPDNPSEGTERAANDIIYARISTQAFFGVVWKTIFAGMQNIMMKSGRYE